LNHKQGSRGAGLRDYPERVPGKAVPAQIGFPQGVQGEGFLPEGGSARRSMERVSGKGFGSDFRERGAGRAAGSPGQGPKEGLPSGARGFLDRVPETTRFGFPGFSKRIPEKGFRSGSQGK
jgi:hypothetical protein